MIRTIGDLRKAIADLDDDDIIYAVTNKEEILDLRSVEDSTSIGFWEIRLMDCSTAYNKKEFILTCNDSKQPKNTVLDMDYAVSTIVSKLKQD